MLTESGSLDDESIPESLLVGCTCWTDGISLLRKSFTGYMFLCAEAKLQSSKESRAKCRRFSCRLGLLACLPFREGAIDLASGPFISFSPLEARWQLQAYFMAVANN